MPPSYIRVHAVVWAYGRGQTDRHTQTHMTTIHFASSTTHAKCNNITQWIFLKFVWVKPVNIFLSQFTTWLVFPLQCTHSRFMAIILASPVNIWSIFEQSFSAHVPRWQLAHWDCEENARVLFSGVLHHLWTFLVIVHLIIILNVYTIILKLLSLFVLGVRCFIRRQQTV